MTLRRYHVRRVYEARFQIITASSPSAAVCEWARCYDRHSVEYPIARSQERPVVIVTDESGRSCGEWIVEGEAVPEYRARPAPKLKGEHT